MADREREPTPCPAADLSVWNSYSSNVPHASLPVVRTLFERICEAIQARGLGWRAYRQGEVIGFKSTNQAHGYDAMPRGPCGLVCAAA